MPDDLNGKSALNPEVAATERHTPKASAAGETNGEQTTDLHDTRAAKTNSDELPVISGYLVQDEIARGGMGRVLSGHDLTLDREVAIKVLLSTHNAAAARRFVAESKITARLPHPGIPPVYALGELANGVPFLAMKRVRGRTLAELLGARKSISQDLPRWLGIFEQVCQAVGFAHSQHILHRDLKPQNVMVGAFGEVHVMDWGLAHYMQEDAIAGDHPIAADSESIAETIEGHDGLTLPGTIMGTPAYMAPEQARGEALDARADVFAIGGILSVILTGKPAFTGNSSIDVVRKAATGFVSEASDRLDGCGADTKLIDLAKRCLSAEREARPLDAEVVAEEIAAYRAEVEQRLREAELARATADARAAAQKRQRQILTVSGGLVVAVLLAGAAISTMQWLRAENTLVLLTQSQNRNVEHLTKVTEQLVGQRMERQSALSDADREFIQGLLPMWQELASARGNTEESLTLQAKGHFQVGFLQDRLGEYEDARREFNVAAALLEKLVTDFPDVPEHRKKLARTHNSLGILLRNVGEDSQSEQHYLTALKVKRQLAADFPADTSYRRDLAGAHNNLARLYGRNGRFQEAEEQHRQSLAIRKQLVSQVPTDPDLRRDLAESHNNLGILFANCGRLGECENWFLEALKVRKELAKDFPAPENRQLLAGTHNNLGILFYQLGRPEEAEEQFRLSLDLKAKMAEEFPAVPSYRGDLANARVGLGVVLNQIGKHAAAEELFRASVAVTDELATEYPDVPLYRQLLGNACNGLGAAIANEGNRDEAEKFYFRALTIYEALVLEFPSVHEYKVEFVSPHYNLALLYASAIDSTEDEDKQREYGDQAMEMLQKVVELGWNDVARLESDAELATLRSREDFQKLLTQLTKDKLPR